MVFNLKRLKEKIKEWEDRGVDENTPIMYERIEDGYFNTCNWKTTPVHISTQYNIKNYGQGIAPFDMYLSADDKENPVILLTAHY